MREIILKLIASSKNSHELADRICEVVEEEKQQLTEYLLGIMTCKIPNSFCSAHKSHNIRDYIELSRSTPATPEDSRRDVGKGK